MSIIIAIAGILTFVHLFLLGSGSFVRWVRLNVYIKRFYENGVISEAEHSRLLSDGFFIFQSAPDFLEFRKLYDDPKFLAFVLGWKRRRNYYLTASILLFIFFLGSPGFSE